MLNLLTYARIAARTPIVLSEYYRGTVRRSLPCILRLAVTTRCNAECSFCPYRDCANPQTMTMADYRALLDLVSPHTTLVDFSFAGEPLLHPGLFDMIRIAKSRGIGVNVHTNGIALDEERSRLLAASGADLVVINLNASIKEGDRLVNTDDLNPEFLEHLRYFLSVNGRSGVPVVLQAVVPPAAAPMDVRDFRSHLPLGGKCVFRVKAERFLDYECAPPDIPNWRCYRLYQELDVSPTGDVVLCCYDTECRTTFGNVLQEGLQETWARRMNHARSGGPVPLCRGCPDNRLALAKILANALTPPAWSYHLYRWVTGLGKGGVAGEDRGPA